MKRWVFFIGIVLVFLADQGYSQEPSKASWQSRFGPREHNQDHYVVGTEKIRFAAGFSFPREWRNELAINRIARDMVEHHDDCHVAKTWRWQTVPETSKAVLILAWLNLDNGDYGWSAIKNTEDHWYVSSDYQEWTTQARYSRNERMNFRWSSVGTRIEIRIRNPDNEHGWTSEDIWYSFHYRD